MPDVMDRGGSDEYAEKREAAYKAPTDKEAEQAQTAEIVAEEKAKDAAKEQGWQSGVSPGARWAYWEYLKRWNACGKHGRRWTMKDVAQAHGLLATALSEKDEEKVAGLKRFLLLDEDCGEPTTDDAEAEEHSGSEAGSGDTPSGDGDVPDIPDVRPRRQRRPKAER